MGLFGVDLEQEKVPRNKNLHISTRENSEYKWQTKGVIGALEVPSQPVLHLREDYLPHTVTGKESAFNKAVKVWEKEKLRHEFIEACESAPVAYCCCGLVQDTDQQFRELCPYLNRGWIEKTNERLAKDGIPLQLNAYLWCWHNATGKAETYVLLIRFFEEKPKSQRRLMEEKRKHDQHRTDELKAEGIMPGIAEESKVSVDDEENTGTKTKRPPS